MYPPLLNKYLQTKHSCISSNNKLTTNNKDEKNVLLHSKISTNYCPGILLTKNKWNI